MACLGLLDCNSFFASCEQVFAPRLVGKPVVVLSNNDGCVVARSPEAKRLGIPMGAPFFEVKNLCQREGVTVFSSNFRLYNNMSHRVMECLRQWTPNLEIYSVDEAFMDFTGMPNAETDDFQRHLVQTVTRWTGIPVSLGVARTKTLAKVANHVAKKREIGFFTLTDSGIVREILPQVPVEDVWGIGRRTAPKLNRLGIRTAWDLMNADPLAIRKEFSIVLERTVRELRGEPCLEFGDEPAPKQSIQISRSFADKITDLESLERPVSSFLVRAAEKLRGQGGMANAVFLTVMGRWLEPQVEQGEDKDGPKPRAIGWGTVPRWMKTCPAGTYYSDSRMLPVGFPCDDTRHLLPLVLAGLRQIFRPNVGYKKAGVTLLGLTLRGENQQIQLFDNTPAGDAQRDRRLMETLDHLRAQLGPRAISFGTEGLSGQDSWRGRSEKCSPDYTGNWDEIPTAK